jgi:hypothetical protein
MRLIPIVLATALLAGCVPLPGGFVAVYPHTTTRLDSISGTVLDERTHSPIAGVEVSLTQYPKVACESDSSGHFMLKEIHSWHWGIGVGAGNSEDYPYRPHWDPIITVSHTNYTPRHGIDWWRRGDDIILLKKLGEPSEPRPWLIFNDTGVVVKDMGAGQYLKPDGISIIRDHGNATAPRIHIEFVQRVYDPHVTPVSYTGMGRIEVSKCKGYDWDFWISDLSRNNRLEFTP